MSLLLRPKFTEYELLTSSDLSAEQQYQLDLARKHRAGAHLHGVVDGLQISKDASGVKVEAGYAVDTFGRDLVLDSACPLDGKIADALLAEPGADAFEVLLHYNQQLESDRQAAPRLAERPRVEVRALIGKIADEMPYDVTQTAPDDPSFRRPVRLGVLQSDPAQANEWLLMQDAASRQEAGVVAARIVPANNPKGLQSSVTLANGEFAVTLPRAPKAGQPAPADDPKCLSITAAGASFRSSLVVEGDVDAGGQLLLPQARPDAVGSKGYGLFHVGDPNAAPDQHELRLVLPAQGALAIGAFDSQSGKFKAVLTVDARTRSVTVEGDLFIEGAVIQPVGTPPVTNTEQGSAPVQSEEPAMLGNIGTAFLGLGQMSARTAGGLIPLLIALWAGIFFDGTAGLLPCEAVNKVRSLLQIKPLLCHTVSGDFKLGGDSQCAHNANGKRLTQANGELVSSTDNEVAKLNNAVVKISEAVQNALKDEAIVGFDSVWLYCKTSTSEKSPAVGQGKGG